MKHIRTAFRRLIHSTNLNWWPPDFWTINSYHKTDRVTFSQASTRAQATVDAESSLESAQKTEAQKQAEFFFVASKLWDFPIKIRKGWMKMGRVYENSSSIQLFFMF